MLPIEKAEMKNRILILLSRFSPDYTHTRLIPEIESNCVKYHVEPSLIKNFQKHKFAENSQYFAHNYAYADIPTGQKYEYISYIENYGRIVPDSITECNATVLCFFSNYKVRPLEFANHGHHETCLIQFHGGIPKVIDALTEFTEKSRFLEYKQLIGLFSYDTLKANIPDWEES